MAQDREHIGLSFVGTTGAFRMPWTEYKNSLKDDQNNVIANATQRSQHDAVAMYWASIYDAAGDFWERLAAFDPPEYPDGFVPGTDTAATSKLDKLTAYEIVERLDSTYVAKLRTAPTPAASDLLISGTDYNAKTKKYTAAGSKKAYQYITAESECPSSLSNPFTAVDFMEGISRSNAVSADESPNSSAKDTVVLVQKVLFLGETLADPSMTLGMLDQHNTGTAVMLREFTTSDADRIALYIWDEAIEQQQVDVPFVVPGKNAAGYWVCLVGPYRLTSDNLFGTYPQLRLHNAPNITNWLSLGVSLDDDLQIAHIQTSASVNTLYIDSLASSLLVSIIGDLYVSGSTTVSEPTLDAHVATKNYVDEAVAEYDYFATGAMITNGTQTSGTYATTNVHDNTFWVIREVTGVPGYDIEINFSSVAHAPTVCDFVGYYDGSHTIAVQLWNYTSSAWETYLTLVPESGNTWHSFNIPDPAEHVDGSGNMRMRLYHANNGNTYHYLRLDYIALRKAGFGGTTDHGSLSGLVHDDHKQYLLTDGSRALTGAIQMDYNKIWLDAYGGANAGIWSYDDGNSAHLKMDCGGYGFDVNGYGTINTHGNINMPSGNITLESGNIDIQHLSGSTNVLNVFDLDLGAYVFAVDTSYDGISAVRLGSDDLPVYFTVQGNSQFGTLTTPVVFILHGDHIIDSGELCFGGRETYFELTDDGAAHLHLYVHGDEWIFSEGGETELPGDLTFAASSTITLPRDSKIVLKKDFSGTGPFKLSGLRPNLISSGTYWGPDPDGTWKCASLPTATSDILRVVLPASALPDENMGGAVVIDALNLYFYKSLANAGLFIDSIELKVASRTTSSTTTIINITDDVGNGTSQAFNCNIIPTSTTKTNAGIYTLHITAKNTSGSTGNIWLRDIEVVYHTE